MTKLTKTAGLELVKLCIRALDDKKAENLKVFDVSAQSSITDYLLLATATSEPHLRALRIEIEKALDATGSRIVGIEMAQESGWVVIDAFDVMIHLFLAQVREHYSLERLWSDATELSLPRLLAKPEPRKATKRATAAGKPAAGKARKPVSRRKPRG
ncbi:ribosome silencing factor [Opitutus sp. ER46]|uniref:ribosome silencing factor n=1 Tax=Opitutus sp. ER46 TaxID=2161864 RepID=UPI000D319B9B|nr:ribosome silencing factor [Opitutus sp. ER46]PTX95537.1 ribosome silencing factor [Opitutus sp. ER46]